MKRNRNRFITITAVFLMLLGLVGSLFLKEGAAERVVNVITAATAVIGAFALLYQFRRDKNLNEASFLVEYSNEFYSTYQCADLMNELEKCRVDPAYRLDVESNYQQIVGYLEWLETLASLISTGVLQISRIDNVMSYRYFLIVNNKQVQDGELLRNRDFYRSIYALYPIWADYKRKNGLPIIFEENELSKTEAYQEMMTKKKH